MNRRLPSSSYRNYFRRPWVKAILGVIVLIVLIRFLVAMSINSTTIQERKPEKLGELQYMIVGDLGSSGSRIYVYTYRESLSTRVNRCRLGAGGQYPKIELLDGFEELLKTKKRNEKKPGISSIARPPYSGIPEYFEGLLTFASSLIPEEQRKQTPIYFFATAGLRNLAQEIGERLFDDDEMDEDFMLDADDEDFGVGNVHGLISALRDYFREYPDYVFEDSHIKVLTGEEEALFDWMALQQALHNGETTMAKTNDIPIRPGSIIEGGYSMGMIDTGGASSQISYIPKDPSKGNMICSAFGSSDITVYARSFLDYGMYESRSIMEENVLAKCIASGCAQVTNPCFLRGNMQHISFGGRSYEVSGTGDFAGCYEEVFYMFELPECEFDRCAVRGVPLPDARDGTKFLAIDNVNRAASFFGVQGYSTLAELETRVKDYCQLEWNVAVEKYEATTNSFRLKRYCYEGVYILVLFHHGYKFPMDYQDVAYVDYIGGKHINWPLGAAAYELNQLCMSKRT